jgi:2-dehydro-3-deoxyphosphogluconate aldolase/(4S)-4-hydroxy-2-oxoglutarate aldolase
MATRREETLAAIAEVRLGAIIRTKDRALAAEAMHAAVRGGFRMIEFTMNTPDALGLIAEFSRESGLIVGAGTVMSPADAEGAVAAGARFIVSPNFDAEVVRAARRLDAVSIPGTYTPTEMFNATVAGADIVKLFPAPENIAQYVRQIAGPLPDLRIFPTAGVNMENFRAILEAGAFGVGFVSSLFTPEDMQAQSYAAIEKRAAEIFALLSWR